MANKYKIGDVLKYIFFEKFKMKRTKRPVTQKEILQERHSHLSIIEGIENGRYELRTPGSENYIYLPCDFVDDPTNDYVLDFSF